MAKQSLNPESEEQANQPVKTSGAASIAGNIATNFAKKGIIKSSATFFAAHSGAIAFWGILAAIIVGAVLYALTVFATVSPILMPASAGSSCSSATSNAKIRAEIEKIPDEAARAKALEQYQKSVSQKTPSAGSLACMSTFDGELAPPFPSSINPDGTFTSGGIYISSPFGPRGIICNNGYCSTDYHNGTDFAGKTGTVISAAMSGTVTQAGWAEGGCGNAVYVKTEPNIITWYCHNSKVLVDKGDTVVAGQPIAELGTTGNSTGPHLHLEIRVDRKPIDAYNFFLEKGIDLYGIFGEPRG